MSCSSSGSLGLWPQLRHAAVAVLWQHLEGAAVLFSGAAVLCSRGGNAPTTSAAAAVCRCGAQLCSQGRRAGSCSGAATRQQVSTFTS
jgi:hypothetical protein